MKQLSNIFGFSIDCLFDDVQNVSSPVLREQIILDKNNYNNRYNYVIAYLKKNYNDKGTIYALTELGKENSKLTDITEWINSPAIWFLVETKKQNLIVKATKDYIQINLLLIILSC